MITGTYILQSLIHHCVVGNNGLIKKSISEGVNVQYDVKLYIGRVFGAAELNPHYIKASYIISYHYIIVITNCSFSFQVSLLHL